MKDGELAAHLAQEAGRLLLDLRARGGLEGRALGQQGDAEANAYLWKALRTARPDDGLLSEESKDTRERLLRERVWIIDPVDGTREYSEERSDWAVHVALAVKGKAHLGAVALPDRSDAEGRMIVLCSDQPRALAPIPDAPPRFVVSRSRPARAAKEVCEALGGELIPMGSAGAKAMAVVLGEAEIYLHSGGQYEWDSCAPVAVASAHGLHCSRIDGTPIRYNREDPYLPDLLICRSEWAQQVLARLAVHS